MTDSAFGRCIKAEFLKKTLNMKKGEWAYGMFLSEVKGHSLQKRISIRGDLEKIATELNPEFYKRKRRKKLTYITIPSRKENENIC